MKCEGCRNTIITKLNKIDGISNVEIDLSSSSIAFSYTTHNAMEGLRFELSQMGYPITGDSNTIVNKAKSYVNCVVGKISAP